VLTHTSSLPPLGAGVTAAFAPASCDDAVTTIGVAVSAAVFFCFFVLPTSTTGELLGVAVAFAGAGFVDDPKIHQPFFFVGCFFAGDSIA
jgi:hypothetical protein